MERENDIKSVDEEKILPIWIDGERAKAIKGETVLSALFATGKRKISKNDHGKPTGAYCGMGICSCCGVNIDGADNSLACQTVVEQDMRVETLSNRHDKEGLNHA